MSGDFMLYVAEQMLKTALLLAAPVLVATLVVGLAVALVQAVTSVRDMTMGLVLKLACVGLTLLVAGGWMMEVAVSFTADIFNHIESMGH